MSHQEFLDNYSAEVDTSYSFFAENGGRYHGMLRNGSKINVVLEDGSTLQISGEIREPILKDEKHSDLTLTEEDLAGLEECGEIEL